MNDAQSGAWGSFDLLIFDCDGVLVDSEMLAIKAMRSVLNEAGVPATEAIILKCFGMKQADTLARIAELTGRSIPAGLPEQLWPAIRDAFAASLKPMPGIVSFLGNHPKGARCVASSSNIERIRTSLDMTGLSPFFDDNLFSSQQVPRGKPAPDLFLLAASSMGIAPKRCLVIEDSVYGVEGARAAGMTAFGFTGGSHVQADHAETLRAAGAALVTDDWGEIAVRLAA